MLFVFSLLCCCVVWWRSVKTSSHKEGKEHKARKPRDGDKLDEGSDSEQEEVESEEEEEEGVRLFEGVEAPKPDSSKAAEQQCVIVGRAWKTWHLFDTIQCLFCLSTGAN